MSYQIVTDSCADLDDWMLEDPHISLVPLTIQVGESVFPDDGQVDSGVWADRFRGCAEYPKSACPSPMQYEKAWDKRADRVYYVTGSSRLSGSYNSARLAVDMLRERNREAAFCTLDSQTASAGQTLLIRKIQEWEREGIEFSYIYRKLLHFRKEEKTRFVLENTKILEMSGRLGGIKAKLAGTLHIAPVLMGKPDGTIARKGQARGVKKALALLYLQIMEDFERELPELVILSHCHCPKRAESFRRKLLERYPLLPVRVVEMGGIASLYAGEGGIVVAY